MEILKEQKIHSFKILISLKNQENRTITFSQEQEKGFKTQCLSYAIGCYQKKSSHPCFETQHYIWYSKVGREAKKCYRIADLYIVKNGGCVRGAHVRAQVHGGQVEGRGKDGSDPNI